jgi:hypothetical protein
MFKFPHNFPHFPRSGNYIHGQIDNFCVSSQLFHGGDAVSICGNKADIPAFSESIVGGQFRDCRRLAHAGWPYEGNKASPTGFHGDGACGFNPFLKETAQLCAKKFGVLEFGAGSLASQSFYKFSGEFFRNVCLDQIGENPKEGFRQFCHLAQPGALAKLLEHSVEVV